MEKDLIVQDYLASYMERDSSLDENRQLASNVFEGAINYAYVVFGNHLILGGAYATNSEDKYKILEHLDAIRDILKKYGSKD